MATPESLRKVTEIKKLIAGGMPIQQAIKQIGLSASTYYQASRLDRKIKQHQRRRTKPAIIVTDLPEVKGKQLCLLIGDSQTIANFVERFMQ